MNAIGYIRVSKDDQALSPHAQRTAMERWCSVHEATLVAVHEEIGVCSADRIEDRPELLAAVDRIGPGDRLLVAKRDRIGRDVINVAMIERLVERAGGRIVSVAGEGTENDDPASLMMRRIVDVFAEYERALIRTRTRAALRSKLERGEWCGKPRLGMEPDPSAPERVRQSDREQRIAALCRLWINEGASLRECGRKLVEMGLHPRKGEGFTWSPESIRRLAS